MSEAELEENRQRLERERQEELDRIDMEKFTLQEMEDQERWETVLYSNKGVKYDILFRMLN